MGGWDEEVFYANLQEGALRIRHDHAAGVPILLEAWQRRPTRAEPLFELAQACRRRGEFAPARMFAERGLEIPYPADVLFIHRWVYDYGLLMERAFAAGGLGDVEQTRADLRTVLDYAELPQQTRHYVEHSLAQLGEARDTFASGAPHRDAASSELDRLARTVGSAPGPGAASAARSAWHRWRRTCVSARSSSTSKPAWPAFNPSIAADGEDGFQHDRAHRQLPDRARRAARGGRLAQHQLPRLARRRARRSRDRADRRPGGAPAGARQPDRRLRGLPAARARRTLVRDARPRAT